MSVLRKQGSCFVFKVEYTVFKCCISHELHLRVTEKARLLQSGRMTHNGHCVSFNIRISCYDSSLELLDDMCTEPQIGLALLLAGSAAVTVFVRERKKYDRHI